jgi:hypothetical protein
MPSRFDPEPDPNPPKNDNVVDTTRRYDVYCVEHGLRTVVYRNVLFRGVRRLFGSDKPYDIVSQVIELEQPNGQSVFINRHGIVRFCEHGTELVVEVVTSK